MLFSQQFFRSNLYLCFSCFLLIQAFTPIKKVKAQTESPFTCGDIYRPSTSNPHQAEAEFDLFPNTQIMNTQDMIEFDDFKIEDIQLKVFSLANKQDLSKETNKNILKKFAALKFSNSIRLPTAAIAQLKTQTDYDFYQITNPKAFVENNPQEVSVADTFNFNQLREQVLAIYIDEGFLLNTVEPVIYLEEITTSETTTQFDNRKFNLIIAIRQPTIGRLYYNFPEVEAENRRSSLFDHQSLCDRLIDAMGGLNQAIDYNTLQNNLIYLRNDPNIDNIEAYLKPYEGREGELLELEILLAEAQSSQLDITFENTTPESIGDYKYALSYANNNASKFGDRLKLGYTGTTTGGLEALNLSYQFPLDKRDKTLTLNFSPSWTRITDEPFNQFNITSRSQFFSIDYHHPLIRRLDKEFAFSLGFELQNGQTFIFNDIPTAFGNGVNDQGITRTSTFVFRQNYVSRSTKGAWLLDSKFSFGSGLFGATTNRWNESGGFFNKWEGYIQRLQKFSETNSLVLQAKIQLTPKTLASSQQFFIGGLNTVRGYRANARTADNGFRFSLDNYITLRSNDTGDPTILLIPFVDLGYVWNNPSTENGLNQPQFLSSMGIGMQFNELFGSEDLNARIYWAHSFSDLKDRGDSLQDDGIYFSLGYTFDRF